MIKLVDIHKIYQDENQGYLALKNVNLDFSENEFVCVLGKSGSGKTTLLNIIGGLDKASSGHMVIDGVLTTKFTETQWDYFRNYKIGFIFQNFSLIEHLTVLDNVMLSIALQGVSKKESQEKALRMLEKVKIKKHANKLPKQLSGGERQRVSIARALVNDPDIILADEPTGSLDKATSLEILELIKEISKEKLVIMVTHNRKLADTYADRIIELKDGEVILDTAPNHIEKVKIVKPINQFTNFKMIDKVKHAIKNIKMKKWRTLLTALGLAIGVCGFILIDGISNGIKINVEKQREGSNLNPDLVFNVKEQTLETLLMDYEEYMEHLLKDNKIKAVRYNKDMILDVVKINDHEVDRSKMSYEPINYQFTNNNKEKYFGKLVDGGRWPSNHNEIVLSGNYAKSLYEIDNINTVWEKLNGGTIEMVSEYYYQFPYEKYETNKNICKTYPFVDEKTVPQNYDFNRFGAFVEQIRIQKDLFNIPVINLEYIENSMSPSITVCENYEPFKIYVGYEPKATKTYTIVGVIETPSINNAFVSKEEYMNMQARKHEIYENGQSHLINVFDVYLEDGVDDFYSLKVKYKDEATIFEQGNQNQSIPIFDIFIELVQFIISLIMFISIITAGIMLLMVLLISVIERSREIGILRSLGATRSDILSIFLVESALLGVMAGVLGNILAVIVSIVGNIIIRYEYRDNLLSAFQTTDINLIIIRPVPSIISIFVCMIFASAFGLFPAIKASKKTPIDALKRL